MENLIASSDRASVEALAARGEPPIIRRAAQIVLLYDEGLPTREIAGIVGLSRSRTRFWRRRFGMQGMAMFSSASLQPGAPVFTSETDKSTGPVRKKRASIESQVGEGQPGIQAEVVQETISWDELRQRYPANLRRAEHRRDLALSLFDGTRTVHHMGDEHRRLLETATLIRYLEEIRDEAKVDTSGYFFILTHPLTEVDEDGLKLVSAVLEYQNGKMDRKALKDLDALPIYQRAALNLAAILRIAFGLDDSNSQETIITEVESQPDLLRVFIDGPQAKTDGRAADKQARLWIRLFHQKVFFHLDSQQASAEEIEKTAYLLSLKSPGIKPEDELAEAGRKVLGFHFADMIRHEEGTRHGVDIEELHDMRVATRRMRAAIDVFGESFEPKVIKAHLKGLRATGRALGRVRDMDVFMEKAQHYLDSLPSDQRQGLDPLLQHWQEERDKDRAEMLRHLNSREYAAFKRKFLAFLSSPGEGARSNSNETLTPHLVEQIVPVFIYDRLAAVRAYGAILPSASIQQMHALRIEFKKFRYTLEYFREVLGPEAKGIIEEVKIMQDHLGDLNDADVACQILRGFLDDLETREATIAIEDRDNPEPIVAYLASRHSERHRLMITFREAWERFDRPEIRVQLAGAVSVL
jgi:CHAD domain-containing protein